ncbi:MAG: hypothetical protein H7Y03_02270 [Chitinophagaceae bacterium]|nr:hypothetical protein [Chitinophagaceae bacterium]
MNTTEQNLEALRDIRSMMERSSRFISLSGWSGISAGTCALIGAWFAIKRINSYYGNEYDYSTACPSCLKNDLITIATFVFIGAFITATLFTFLKSRKEGVAIWGSAARRLLWNTLLPMLTGGFLLWRMMELKEYQLIAPGCLIFYGLALVNGSKYSIGEVRYLGYAEILTGIVALWTVRSGIYYWAFGFGILHIVYGVAMWWKYERSS